MINIIFKKPYKSLSVKLSLFLILLLTTSSSLLSDSFFQASDSSIEIITESNEPVSVLEPVSEEPMAATYLSPQPVEVPEINKKNVPVEDVVSEANKNPYVIKCYTTTGIGSHILHVETENTITLEKLLRDIQSWPGVKRTETQLILSTYKYINPLMTKKKEEENVQN